MKLFILSCLLFASALAQTDYQKFGYAGCYTTAGDRTDDVAISADGVQDCRDSCAAAGYLYFGFECPMSGSAVHCECSTSLTSSEAIDASLCQQFNTASGGHCSGPFVVEGDTGTYYMGAGSYNSLYSVGETEPSYTMGTVYCGYNHAYHSGFMVDDSAPATTAEECRDLCTTTADCLYWDFDGSTFCRLRGEDGTTGATYEAGYTYGMKGCVFTDDDALFFLDASSYSGMGDWHDHSTHGRAVTNSGAAWDASEKAFDFRPSTAVMSTELNISPSQYTDLTMELWVKLNSIANIYGWVAGQDDGGYDRTILLHDQRYGSTGGTGHVASAIGTTWSSNLGPPPLGVWIHVVAVFRQGGDSYVFLNNVKSNVVTANNNEGRSNLYIGNYPTATGDHHADVWIRKFRVYGRALSDDEVYSLYMEGSMNSAGPCASGNNPTAYVVDGELASCVGDFTGHVRDAPLCASGWHVCSGRDIYSHFQVTNAMASVVSGCFAYDAMNDCNGCWEHCMDDAVELKPGCLDSGSGHDLTGMGTGCSVGGAGACLQDTRSNIAGYGRSGCEVSSVPTGGGVMCCIGDTYSEVANRFPTQSPTRLRTLEECSDSTEDFVPSYEIDPTRSYLDGDMVYINVDFPGYMDVLSIEFFGHEDELGLDAWNITYNDGCSIDNTIEGYTSFANLGNIANLTYEGEDIVFMLVTEFEYHAADEVSGEIELRTIELDIPLTIKAPNTYIIQVSFELETDSDMVFDISSQKITIENGVEFVEIEFHTYVGTGFELDGDWSLESTYFLQSQTTLTLLSTEDYTHPEFGPGHYQTWFLRLQNPAGCVEPEHSKTFDLNLVSSQTNLVGDNHVEVVRMSIQFGGATNPNCDHTIGTFEMKSSIIIGDGEVFTTFNPDDPTAAVFYVDSSMYVNIMFESPLPPATTELTSFAISQNGEPKCSDCVTEASLDFQCLSCGESDIMTAGAAYNFSVTLSSSMLTATPDAAMPTTFDLSFAFTYTRRNLAGVDKVFSLPLRINLQDWYCKNPNAIFGAIEKMACATQGASQVSHCSKNGWEEVSSCPEKASYIFWNVGGSILAVSTIALAVFLFSVYSISTTQKENKQLQIITEEEAQLKA